MKYYDKEGMKKLFSQVDYIKPCGHYALVQMIPVDEKSQGGIVIHSKSDLQKELRGRDLGIVIAFGGECFKGFGDCKKPSDWGVNIGDVVELAGKYENKIPRLAEFNSQEIFKDLRIVNDNEIIAVGVINKGEK